jgi:AcrR family transcriptional regulator
MAGAPARRRRAGGGEKPGKGALTRAAIVETLVAMVNERPLDDIHVSELCAANGLAVGAFYFHFASKDEALLAIAGEGLSWLYDRILSAPKPADAFGEIRHVISTFHAAQREKGPLIRAVYRILAYRRPVRSAWIGLRAQAVARLTDALATLPPSPHGFASPYVAAQFLMGAIERFYDDVYVAPPDGRLGGEGSPEDVFVRQQSEAWFRAVTGRDPPTNS